MKPPLDLVVSYQKTVRKITHESVDGPDAAIRFDALVRKVLSVPHDEIIRREAEYKRQSAMNPRRRGPKPKTANP